jgi:hypothetical protein
LVLSLGPSSGERETSRVRSGSTKPPPGLCVVREGWHRNRSFDKPRILLLSRLQSTLWQMKRHSQLRRLPERIRSQEPSSDPPLGHLLPTIPKTRHQRRSSGSSPGRRGGKRKMVGRGRGGQLRLSSFCLLPPLSLTAERTTLQRERLDSRRAAAWCLEVPDPLAFPPRSLFSLRKDLHSLSRAFLPSFQQ